MEKINTIYAECGGQIWDYYFQLEDLKFSPCIIIGEERQRNEAEKREIRFFYRMDANNLDIDFNYILSNEEKVFLQELISNDILFKMFFRNSIDSEIPKSLFSKLVKNYAEMWFWFIKGDKLKALVLHEMPHLPYTYIGYLIFQHLNLQTYFTVTFPIKNKTYFVDKIEHYSLFENKSLEWLNEKENSNEETNYLLKLQTEYNPNQNNSTGKPISFFHSLLVYVRNFLFPSFTNRLYFNMILNRRFVSLIDRRYHFFILIKTIKKLTRGKYYKQFITNDLKESGIKILFALQFEPELAVYPLAGELNNQYEAIFNLSKKLGDKGIIYVKEHPWMFDYSKTQGIIRKKSFYKDLNKLPNVCFINYKLKVKDILNKIDVVCSLTGTIGWEAFLKKIPVIHFGYSWYSGLPGIKHFSDITNFEKFMDQCKNEFKNVDYKRIYELMNIAISNFSVKMKGLNDDVFMQKAKVLKSNLESLV